MNDRVATAIAALISTVWTASVVLDGVWAAYDPPPTIHLLMTMVVGWALGERYLSKRRNGDDNDG